MKRWIPSLLAASMSISGSLEAGVVLRFEVERLIERSVLDGEVLDVRDGQKAEKDAGKPASIRSFRVESRIEYRVEVLEASADEALIAVTTPKVVAEGEGGGASDRFDSRNPPAGDESREHATLRWYAGLTQQFRVARDGVLTPTRRVRPPAEIDSRPQGREDGTVSVERVLSPQILLSDLYAITGAGLRGTPLRAGESYDPMEPGLERGEPEARAAEGGGVKVRTGGWRLARLAFDGPTRQGAEFSILATPGRTLYRPSMGGARPRATPAKAGAATYGLDGFVEEYRIEVRREREAAGVAGPIRVHDALGIRRLR